jgi:ketosteroid isomerase-like protein
MRRWVIGLAALLLVLCAGDTWAAKRDLTAEVRSSERAFAKAMADRDFKSFGTYIAEEGIFFNNDGALRGRGSVLKYWKRYFDGKVAPFSWEPETVEVLPSGKLALTSGPVKDEMGRLFGTFTTVWRQEKDGKWRVLFDKGCQVCEEGDEGDEGKKKE